MGLIHFFFTPTKMNVIENQGYLKQFNNALTYSEAGQKLLQLPCRNLTGML